jgi:hypothetical protein
LSQPQFLVKVGTKIVGVYPVTKFYKAPNPEAMYTTLRMSTGLTFGTISSLFGLSHGIINPGQYSELVATVIASRVVPTVIANAFYFTRHLLPKRAQEAPLQTAGDDHPAAGCDASRLKRGQSMFTEILHANDGSDCALEALFVDGQSGTCRG